ncbi:MAG TPA: circadian clock protein KaiC [Polyangiaceae bacterium]|nr:circadian clock protein KaiC [Polyangiaceae bacterium]
MRKARSKSAKVRTLPVVKKAATGIEGLDSITGGGFPRGRATLICGGPGCGKTLFGMQFIMHGIAQGEPGVVISFEETVDDLTKNVASLGVDLAKMVRSKKLFIDHVRVDRSEILETGGYDLSGLFVRIGQAIASIGAKRILLDTVEVLFSGFSNAALLRAELERLFRWLKDEGLTAVVTGERGDTTLTRQGLEEYISDCVVTLDHRVSEQVMTRRARVVKYRGSTHGTNEYPFLIGERGISVLPITSVGLDYEVSDSRVRTGVPALDEMLGGKGFFRGSGVLVSGTAGTGKSSLAASFAAAACARGERCLYLALEEPASQVVRNMRSIGLQLQPLVDQGLLTIVAARPTLLGLEQHLVSIHAAIERTRPKVLVIDPISSLIFGDNSREVKSMLIRLFDYLKLKGITSVFTSLSPPGGLEETEIGVSSLIDSWIEVREVDRAGERNRALYILKSRGMSHSNQVRELLITDQGLQLIDAVVGPQGVVVGSARVAQQAEEQTAERQRQQSAAFRQRELERKRRVINAQIEALRAELLGSEDELRREVESSEREDGARRHQRQRMRQTKLGAKRSASEQS